MKDAPTTPVPSTVQEPWIDLSPDCLICLPSSSFLKCRVAWLSCTHRCTPHPRFPPRRGEERGAHGTTPLKGSARGFGWNRGLRFSQLGNATGSAARAPPGAPGASWCPRCQRKRKAARFLCRGVVGEDGKVPRAQLAGIFQTNHLVKSGNRPFPYSSLITCSVWWFFFFLSF